MSIPIFEICQLFLKEVFMTFYERLEYVLKLRNLSFYKVSKDTGIDKSAFTHWKQRGLHPSAESLKKLSNYLGVTTSYLLGEDEKENEESTNKIPVLGIVPCGVPIEAIEDIVEYIDVVPTMAKEHFGLIAKGDSMYPFICNGDILIVKKTSCVASGKIAIVKVNGEEACCKKILINENGITLVSLNNSYDPKVYNASQVEQLPVYIIGEVVEIRRRF
jgi:repressor LexA